jgi:hypothetical protein
MIVRSKKLRTALAVVLAAGGIMLATTAPANATRSCGTNGPPPPETSLTFNGYVIEATYITFPCATTPPITQPLISIIRDGTVVASGNGNVSYDCVGSAEGTFVISYFGTYNWSCG